MVLDQQVPLEWAFLGPYTLTQRLGTDARRDKLAAMDEDTLVTVFCDRPALHRYPAAMARRVHELCNLIVSEYDARPRVDLDDARPTARSCTSASRRCPASAR